MHRPEICQERVLFVTISLSTFTVCLPALYATWQPPTCAPLTQNPEGGVHERTKASRSYAFFCGRHCSRTVSCTVFNLHSDNHREWTKARLDLIAYILIYRDLCLQSASQMCLRWPILTRIGLLFIYVNTGCYTTTTTKKSSERRTPVVIWYFWVDKCRQIVCFEALSLHMYYSPKLNVYSDGSAVGSWVFTLLYIKIWWLCMWKQYFSSFSSQSLHTNK